MIRRAFAWTFAAQAVSFCAQFGGSIVVARLLSPHEMGIFVVSIATIGVLQIIAAFGMGNYVVRAVELDATTLDTAFTLNALLGAGLSLAILSVSYVGGQFLGDPAVATVMHWLALVPIIGIFEFRPAAMLQRDMRFKQISFVTAAQALLSTSVVIGSALLGASYLSPAFGGIASAAFGALAYNVIGRRHVAWRLSTRDWRAMTAFGLRMMSIGGIAAMATRLSDIILGHFLGLAALGLYGRASNLSGLIFTNIYGTATRVIFAKLSKDYRERGELREPYIKGLRCITALMGPLLLGLAILSGPAVHLLYGSKWLDAALPLSLMLVAQFVSLSFAMNWEIFVIRDRLALQTKLEISRSAFGLFTKICGSLISIAAAAGSSIVDALFSVWLYAPHMSKLAETKPGELPRVYGEATLLTFVTILPALALMIWYRWSPLTPMSLVVGSIVLGAVLWVVSLKMRRHPLWDELNRTMTFALRSMRSGKETLASD